MTSAPTYLSRNDLLSIHDALIARYGGMPGIRDLGVLESCVAQPQTAVFGVERYPSFEEKAAAYCFFIVRNHPFFDGNKRAGFVSALHFLRLNAIETLFDENDAYDVIIRVAAGAAGLEELTAMIRKAVQR